MADGNLAQTKDSLSALVELEGVSGFVVSSIRLDEGLSKRTTAEVIVLGHEDLDFARALDKPARVSFAGEAGRSWTLRLDSARFVEHTGTAYQYELVLHDPLQRLAHTLNTRKFRNVTARDIITQVLNEQGVPHVFELSREPAQRKYCAQYRESNLAFVERLLEFEGIYYLFQSDGSVLFRDTSPGAPHVRSLPYDLIEADGALQRGDVGIHELSLGQRMTTGTVSLGDYNWKKAEPILEAGYGERDTDLARFEYPAGFRTSAQGATLAKIKAEAYRVGADFLEGKANDPRFEPGYAVEVGGLVADDFAGEYLLVGVTHHFAPGDIASTGTAGRYENEFHSIPLARPYRPFPKTPAPKIAGTHTAMVRGPAGEEIHTDKHGRFRAQFHWDREAVSSDDDSRWLRYLQETSSSMTLARTGWEVLVGYIDGDPDRPVGLGRKINGQMRPTYPQPANMRMMSIKTPSSPATGGFNELKMDDSAGAQHISIQAEKDFDQRVLNDKTETIGKNETHTVKSDFKREIEGDQLVGIGANDTATYGATSELKVKGDRKVSVGGSESVDIGKAETDTVTKGETERVGSVRLSVVGSIVIPDFKKMAQDALKSLIPENPFKGLIAAAKNKNLLKDLLADIEKKAVAQLDTLKPDALLDTAKGAAEDVLKKAGQAIFDKAKESFATSHNAGDAAKAAFDALDPTKVASAAADAALAKVDETVQGAIEGIKNAPQQAVSSFVDGALPRIGGYADGLPADTKFEGAGGFVPSLAQLQQWYSVEAIEKSVTDKLTNLVSLDNLNGVLGKATGGLSDLFIKKEKGQPFKLNTDFGWTEIDKLIDMFSKGGITRSAMKSMKRLVGGAQVEAALNDIEWGSKIAWAETIGVAKLTKTPKNIEQKVEGTMKLTVLGKVTRDAGVDITIDSKSSALTVRAKASYAAKKSLEVNGKEGVKIEGTSSHLVKGAASSFKLTPGSLVISGKMITIDAPEIVFSGGKLNVG